MLELLFGMVFGVWMGQQFPLPNVQLLVHNWWFRPPPTTVTNGATKQSSDDETKPLFTGEMPPAV